MTFTHQVKSTLDDRYRTTLPKPVRRALQLAKRDKLRYTVHPGGEVVLSRAAPDSDADPVLGAFLGFLASDIASNPERLSAMDAAFVRRLRLLTGGCEVDLDAALPTGDRG